MICEHCPECETKTGRLGEICRGEVLTVEKCNHYRATWGLPPLPGTAHATPVRPMPAIQRAKTLASVMAKTATKAITTGQVYAPADVREARLTVCQTCEHFNKGTCKLCGCSCSGKASLTNKLAHASSICPIGKWGATEAVPAGHIKTAKTPSPSDPETPIPATISDSRNLIYHIWPNNKTDAWKWNIKQICDRIELFNGVRSVGIATGNDTASVDEVRAAFNGHRIDNWIIKPNDAKNREGVTFRELMETLSQDDSTTFYGHAKGVRHHAGSLTLRWAEVMYRVCLDDWQAVADMLRQFPIAGSFKRYGDFKLPRNFRWHYSGTYFWFRNRETFSRDWQRLQAGFFAQVEAWPANIYTATEAGCLFGDNAGDLYQEKELSKWETLLKLSLAGAPATVAQAGST